MSALKLRIEVERIIAHQVIDDLLEAGYEIAIDYGDGLNEAGAELTRDRKMLLAAVQQADDERIYVRKPGETSWAGWVLLVYGNDGHDLISDYTVNLEPVLAKSFAVGDAIEEGRFTITPLPVALAEGSAH